MIRTLITAAAAQPVTVAEVATAFRLDATAEQAEIEQSISAARAYLEVAMNIHFITQTWEFQYPSFANLTIPAWPVQSITSVKYVDSTGATSDALSTSVYHLVKAKPSRVMLKYQQSWPTATLETGEPVIVRAVTGFGAASTAVPDELRQLVIMMAGDWLDNPESWAADGKPAAPRFRLADLIDLHRVMV